MFWMRLSTGNSSFRVRWYCERKLQVKHFGLRVHQLVISHMKRLCKRSSRLLFKVGPFARPAANDANVGRPYAPTPPGSLGRSATRCFRVPNPTRLLTRWGLLIRERESFGARSGRGRVRRLSPQENGELSAPVTVDVSRHAACGKTKTPRAETLSVLSKPRGRRIIRRPKKLPR